MWSGMLMQLPETCCLPTRLLRDRATLAQVSRLRLSLPAWSTGALQQMCSCDDRSGFAEAGQCRLTAALQPGSAEVRH